MTTSNCHGALERERVRLLEDLRHRHNDDVRIASEACQGNSVLANPGGVYSRARGVDYAASFIADDAGDLGRILIQTLAREDVGEVNANGLDTNSHLAWTWCRVRRLAHV